jgi:hypothetical protein
MTTFTTEEDEIFQILAEQYSNLPFDRGALFRVAYTAFPVTPDMMREALISRHPKIIFVDPRDRTGPYHYIRVPGDLVFFSTGLFWRSPEQNRRHGHKWLHMYPGHTL